MKKILLTITFFSLSFFSYANDQYDAQLNNLFNQLKSTGSSIAAKEIETKIWKMWTTHPSEESLTNLLAKGSYYMSQNQLTSAHNVFSKAIELDPKWAEAWNKRATVLYLMGNYELSQNDIDEVLKSFNIFSSLSSFLSFTVKPNPLTNIQALKDNIFIVILEEII